MDTCLCRKDLPRQILKVGRTRLFPHQRTASVARAKSKRQMAKLEKEVGRVRPILQGRLRIFVFILRAE